MKRTKPALNRTQEVISLHDEIDTALKNSLQNAIRIGEILTEIRSEAKHGEWLPWVKENMPFTDQTARNYMKLFDNRAKFKTDLNLKEAYQLLAPLKLQEPIDVDFIEMETEPADGSGMLVMDLSDADMKLCALIEEALITYGDTYIEKGEYKITGLYSAGKRPRNGSSVIYVYPSYGENEEIYVMYEFVFIYFSPNDDEPRGHVEFSKRGVILSAFMLYLLKDLRFYSEDINWFIEKTKNEDITLNERIKHTT